MTRYIDITGKTEEDAIEAALRQLSLERDEVSVEVLERAKAGFLGIGATDAKVRVSYDDGAPEPEPAAFRPEQRKTQAERDAEAAAAKAERARRAAAANAPKPELPKEFAPEVRQGKGERRERPARAETPRSAPAALGEEVHDEKAEQIRAFLTGLLAHLGSAATVKVYLGEEDRYRVFLEGDKSGALIGRRGEMLDAIQQLTGYAVNHGSERGHVRVQVDTEGYREKREQSLTRLAEKTAAKAIKERRNVTLEPMNAYERHVIHAALQEAENVSTFSVGTEPNRRVVVAYNQA